MVNDDDRRRAELIALSLAGALSDEERAELERRAVSDPTIHDEIARLRPTAAAVASVGEWHSASVSDALRARVRAIPESAAGETGGSAAPPVTRRRGSRIARWLVPVSAAACLALGLGLGLLIAPTLSAPQAGPPGTLGAIEHTDMRVGVDGVLLETDLVAHTWGTEAVIDATGLAEGQTYSVVVIGLDGSEFSAGEMLGSVVPIHCSLNAAVLREDVAGIEVRDDGGRVVAAAEVPRV